MFSLEDIVMFTWLEQLLKFLLSLSSVFQLQSSILYYLCLYNPKFPGKLIWGTLRYAGLSTWDPASRVHS